ncbi:MAG: GntR family transcriptional regulator [Crocinitomicaceae bacterium]|nr:GntR family transcriptional regulator [Crocinitomicaceae bacterium]
MQIGIYNNLEVLRFTSVGAFLGNASGDDVLLPNRYVPHNLSVGDKIRVFLYNDSEDRLIATTEEPLIQLNEFAYLMVNDTNNFGAFLDMGLLKDLFVPFKEQTVKMKKGGMYLVYMYIDEQTHRLVGTAKIKKHLFSALNEVNQGDQVQLLICERTELGQKVIVNQQYEGLIFEDQITKDLQIGEQLNGYVYYIRTDGKLDISLNPIGIEKFDYHTEIILNYLLNHNKQMYFTDQSSPDEIRTNFGMSKKSFKKALGALYKAKKIQLLEDKVLLND